nr:putative pathogenesis-related protein [Quercus suber]
MRSAIVAAAFVAGAIAVPYQKRDVVTDVDMAYVTEVVTVTAGEALPTETTTTTKATSVIQAAHFGHHSWHVESSSSTEAAPVETSVFTSIVVPTTEAAPSTTSSSSSTWVYVAPTTSSTPEVVLPTTTPPVVISTIASPSPSADSTSESSAKPTSYEEIAVYHHNIHRANHSAPDIAWSDDLASTAATIAASCVYAHDTTTNGGGYGQNIAAGVEPANISAIITDLFYNGEVGWFTGYGDANPDMTEFEHWGHFSQIVWKASTHVGCATQHCPGGLANTGSGISPYFTVCNYKEVGNMGGEYGENIGESLGRPTADWNAGGIS